MYPTANEIRIAIDVLSGLIDEGFIKGLSYKENPHGYYVKEIYEWCENHEDYFAEKHLFLTFGESKVCVVADVLKNWVIKVDFNKRADPFYGPDYPSMCQIEANNYKCACARGIEGYFAATYAMGSVNGLNYFLQERVIVDEEAISSSFQEYCCVGDEDEEDMNEIYMRICDMDDDERLKAIFGEDEGARELVDFVDEFEINDLHEGNYGIRKDGSIVIIDFSGYIG